MKKQEEKNVKKNTSKGITLIALVLTIIVLLILAGVSIAMLTGENGILTQATKAKAETEIAEIKERIQTDILGVQAKYEGKISEGSLEEILKKYGKIKYETDGTTIKSIITKKGNHEILIADIWTGETDIIADGSWDGEVNSPKLMSGMTGVYWDNSGNEVEVTEANKNNWYDYENQKWANAKTKDGSYWTWIPRYEYEITGTTVNIKFIPTSTTEVESGYKYIHPAFQDGSEKGKNNNWVNGEWDKEIPGFWVAKYAAGFQKSTTDASGTVINSTDKVVYSDKMYESFDSSYKTNALDQNLVEGGKEKISYPVFKPLTYAYNVISTGDSYTIAQEIDSATSFYGLNSSSTDSHMMKNSEWGAVAYLTQSKYGRSGTEVTINDKNLNNLSSKYIFAVTGYEKSTANGVGASSTNNMSGVFDLNGCVWERVAAYITNGNSNIGLYGSSYASTTANAEGYKTLSTKYATVYPYKSSDDKNTSNWTTYNGLKNATYGYGDAILETSTAGSGTSADWHGDYSDFPDTSNPFFLRGGQWYGETDAGAFAFHHTYGGPIYVVGFRAVLVGI